MNTFAALADPVRTGIIDSLVDRPRTVNEIVAMFDVTQPAISRHLRILRDVGLVYVKPEGQRRVYHLNPAPLREIDGWLQRYRKFWSGRLDNLERHLEENP